MYMCVCVSECATASQLQSLAVFAIVKQNSQMLFRCESCEFVRFVIAKGIATASEHPVSRMRLLRLFPKLNRCLQFDLFLTDHVFFSTFLVTFLATFSDTCHWVTHFSVGLRRLQPKWVHSQILPDFDGFGRIVLRIWLHFAGFCWKVSDLLLQARLSARMTFVGLCPLPLYPPPPFNKIRRFFPPKLLLLDSFWGRRRPFGLSREAGQALLALPKFSALGKWGGMKMGSDGFEPV